MRVNIDFCGFCGVVWGDFTVVGGGKVLTFWMRCDIMIESKYFLMGDGVCYTDNS